MPIKTRSQAKPDNPFVPLERRVPAGRRGTPQVSRGEDGDLSHLAGKRPEQLDRATIEVRIHEVSQIFNSFDPSPFTERDLDDDAEAYIVGWAREVDVQGPFRIIVHLATGEANKARQRDLGSAIRHYFAYRAGMLERDLSDLFRVGWR